MVAQDNEEMDDVDLTVRLVAGVQKPIQGECSSETPLITPKIFLFVF